VLEVLVGDRIVVKKPPDLQIVGLYRAYKIWCEYPSGESKRLTITEATP
jgi:hypothetical protein